MGVAAAMYRVPPRRVRAIVAAIVLRYSSRMPR
jgi:hypothetical protein